MNDSRASPASKSEQKCECLSLPDLAVVRMGGRARKLLSTLKRVRNHGRKLHWLYLSKCRVCGQNWLIAEEQRVYDDYYMRRLDPVEAQKITELGRWPDEFITYERVLKIGRELSTPCVALNPLSSFLVQVAEDLRKERPNISIWEIAYLLGVSPTLAAHLCNELSPAVKRPAT